MDHRFKENPNPNRDIGGKYGILSSTIIYYSIKNEI